MARRGGRRGGTKMRSSKSIKRRSYNYKRKPMRKDAQQRKKRRKDKNSEVDATLEGTIQERRLDKGKKVEPQQSENKAEASQSLATSQETKKSLEETSVADPTTKKDDLRHDSDDNLEEAKNRRINCKEKQQRSTSESESKVYVDKKSSKKAAKRGTRGQQRKHQRGERTPVSKDSKLKQSDLDGNKGMNQTPVSKEQQQQQKGDAKESKEEGNERVANNPKEVEHLPEVENNDTSSSSG